MKTLWKVLGVIGLLLAFSVPMVIGKLAGRSLSNIFYSSKKEVTVDEMLLKAANALNAKLPIMVDSETRLDSASGTNKNLRYNYTLVNYPKPSVSAQHLRNSLESQLVNNVCTSKEMEVFVKNGATISYAYYGNDGNQITVITVLPSQCVQVSAKTNGAINSYDLEPFIVQIYDRQTLRYAKLRFSLELLDRSYVTEVDNKLASVRDSILIILSTKTLQDIDDVKGKTLLKEEIAGTVNKIFAQKIIGRVMINEFVVQ